MEVISLFNLKVEIHHFEAQEEKTSLNKDLLTTLDGNEEFLDPKTKSQEEKGKSTLE